jgi:hypothetical protein
MLLGCSDMPENTEQQRKARLRAQEKLPPYYTVITIEGCEYFRFYSANEFAHITHKGDCKNPIHNK